MGVLENHCLAGADDPAFWALITGGAEVKRDDDFLRQLLQEYEAEDHYIHHTSNDLNPSTEQAMRDYHTLLLVDAGMMTAVARDAYRITSAGHDFLALTRRSEAWEASKVAIRHLGGASIQMLYRAAEGYARQKLAEAGVPLE